MRSAIIFPDPDETRVIGLVAGSYTMAAAVNRHVPAGALPRAVSQFKHQKMIASAAARPVGFRNRGALCRRPAISLCRVTAAGKYRSEPMPLPGTDRNLP